MKILRYGTAELVHQVRVLATFPEDPSSVPSNNMASPGLGPTTHCSGLHGHYAYDTQTYMHAEH